MSVDKNASERTSEKRDFNFLMEMFLYFRESTCTLKTC